MERFSIFLRILCELSKYLSNFFINVEVGELTEQLMEQTLGFYLASGEKE